MLPAALPTRPTAAAAAEKDPAGTASRSPPPHGPIYVTLTTDVLPSSAQRNGNFVTLGALRNSHIRTRARGETLILESDPPDDPTPHARLRRDTIHLWYLEMPGRGGRWEPTGIRGTRAELLEALVGQFPWMMMDHGAEPATN